MKTILIAALFALTAGACCAQERSFSNKDCLETFGLECHPPKPDNPTPKLEPKHPYANRNFWIGSALMGASSSAPWIGGNICRSNNGVEPCTEHYGAYNLANGLSTGASVFAGPALFYGCRKAYENSKWCWLIPGVVVGWNVTWGVHEARINHPDTTPEFIRRRK